MKQRTRRYFTQPEMEEVWDRWESGESLNSIARSLERGHSAVQGMLSRTGGGISILAKSFKDRFLSAKDACAKAVSDADPTYQAIKEKYFSDSITAQ